MKRERINATMMRSATLLTTGLTLLGPAAGITRAQPPPPTELATTTALTPKIQFATPVYDFGRVKANEPVHCEFIFTNTGLALLEITTVQPSCGCTATGNWTRQVEPGKTGVIPIQFNGVGAPGPVGKSITVTCNDPSQSTLHLQIKGVLWKPVEVNPPYAMFNVTPDSVSNATSLVRIVSHEESPLILGAPEINNPAFAADVKTTQPGKEFEVIIRLVPPLPNEHVQGVINFKTSSTNHPVVQINAAAVVQPTLIVSPDTIILPPPPNTNNVRPVIYIRNNSQNAFHLSEPAVNAPGVDVEIKEIEPGRYASLTFTFPQEFKMSPGEKIHLTVKTGLSSQPTMEVPVFQRPQL